jgi:hypothetical protein
LTSVAEAVIEAYKLAPRIQHKKRESPVVVLQNREEEKKKEGLPAAALCNNER